MDQLKDAGVWIKKNYFWLLAALCGILSVTFWFMATSGLAGEAATWLSSINQAEQTAQSVVSTPNHPNSVTHTKMDERIDALADDVFAAWDARYDKQRKYLTWHTFLGDQFIAKVSRLQPIEQHVSPDDPREILNPNERERYRNFIDRALPQLAEIIDTPWHEEVDASSSSVGGPGEKSFDGVVDWSVSNQKEIHESRFSWPGRPPTTLEILYAQEDYWVLDAILRIIKQTNGDISQRYQAAIKTVKFIDIGRDAIGFGGAIVPASSSGGSAGGGDSMMPGGMGMSGPGGMAGSSPGGTDMMSAGMASAGNAEAQGSGTPSGDDPGDNRYIDTEFKPVAAKDIRNAFSSTSASDAYLIVAKRMPVRLGLVIDHRQLPKLLAECGNADLQVEVRQVRIGVESLPDFRTFVGGGAAAGGSGLMGGMDQMSGSGGGGMFGQSSTTGGGDDDGGGDGGIFGSGGGGMAGMSGGMYGGGGATQMKLSDDSPNDVHVEIYGIIYIYNPVNREKLGKAVEQAGEETEASEDGTTPATGAQPAAGANNAGNNNAAGNNAAGNNAAGANGAANNGANNGAGNG